jgi:hypothetical protein
MISPLNYRQVIMGALLSIVKGRFSLPFWVLSGAAFGVALRCLPGLPQRACFANSVIPFGVGNPPEGDHDGEPTTLLHACLSGAFISDFFLGVIWRAARSPSGRGGARRYYPGP